MNRLGAESSPYLRQHADNPVDWYPWGDEAAAAARELDRPIFLSVGYSACHWCHVMAHESFEDPEVAALMNRLFVNVKVDREERPDVDAVYMQAVQASPGRLAMSVWRHPTAGRSTAPIAERDRPGITSFTKVCEVVAGRDEQRRRRTGEQAHRAIDETVLTPGHVGPRRVLLGGPERARPVRSRWGGFGRRPSSPRR
jgi:uncharacterized protein YyaL (SSP411 family)